MRLGTYRIYAKKAPFKKRKLGECILMSCLPGKASRTLVESRDLPSHSTCVLEAKPGKLDIERRQPGPGITMPP